MGNRAKAVAPLVVLIALFCGLAHAGEQPAERILGQDNSAFAVDLYQELCASDGNVFFSPYSVSTALAMTYGGARGNTELEMAKTLRFSLNQDDLHPAFAKVQSRLNQVQKADNITLSIANSLWPQQGYRFLDEYLSLILESYDASITPVDFTQAPEDAGTMINKWVEDKTQDKIKDLIQPGTLDPLTRLLLVSAIYFKGNWQNPFPPKKTENAPFHISLEESVQAPMMTQEEELRYANCGSFELLELPYAGYQVSMYVLLPKTLEGLSQVEASLSTENLERWKDRLRDRKVLVFMPRFKMTSTFRLDKTLVSLGMVDAFSSTRANLAGMDGNPDRLYVGAVIHQAFVDVNEEGTEAAAATAVEVETRAMEATPTVFRADHPFVFIIQENWTWSILFMGRVADPTGNGE